MTIRSTRRAGACAAAILLAAMTACGDGPSEPVAELAFDAEAALADYRALTILVDAASFAGLEAMVSRLHTVEGGTAAAGVDSSGPARVPIISEGRRGTTFVYDPAEDRYVPDPARAGAPETGVRFVLYEVDPGTNRPLVDQEIGHSDLFDLGDDLTSGLRLRMVVTAHDRVVLDYEVGAAGDEAGGAFEVEGALAGGDAELSFAMEARHESDGSLERAENQFDVDIAERDFSVHVEMSHEASGGASSGAVEMAVRHGEDAVEIEIHHDDGALEATFSVNGTVVAEARGSARAPAITGPDGTPLTPDRVRVFAAILRVQHDISGLLEALTRPAGEILRLGIAL